MRRIVRIAAWLLGGLLVLLLLGAVALYLFVDAELYRDVLRARLETTLGREVRFGEMDVSVFPTLGLRLDDFEILGLPDEKEPAVLSAKSLSVGARLLPLLRRRLEVTSVVVNAPVATLRRGADGSWQPSLPPAGEAPAEPATDGGPALSVESVRIRDGKLHLSLERADPPGETRLSFEDLSLRFSSTRRGGRLGFEVATSIAGMPGSRLRASGKGEGLLVGGARPATLDGRFDLERVDARVLAGHLDSLLGRSVLAADLLGSAPLSLSAEVGYRSDEGEIFVDGVKVSGIRLDLKRSRDGRWNAARLLETEGAADAPAAPPRVRFGSLSVEDATVHVEDHAASPAPYVVELTGVRLAVAPGEPDTPTKVDLAAAIESRPRGTIEASLSLGPAGPTRRVEGRIEASSIDPAALGVVSDLLPLPPGLVKGRPFGVTGRFAAELGETTRIAVRDPVLQNVDLTLERSRDGSWTGAGGPAAGAGAGPDVSVENLRVENASLTLVDPSAATLALEGLRVTMDRLPTSGAAAIDLAGTVRSPSGGSRLAARGKLGPIGDDALAAPVDLEIELDATPLGPLAPFLPEIASLDVGEGARLAADLAVRGRAADRIDVKGTVTLSGASVAYDAPARGRISVPLDLTARGDVGLAASGGRVELRELTVAPSGRRAESPLSVRGTIDLTSETPRADLRLLPARIVADELAALGALLVPDLPVAFSSPEPVELELAIRGAIGEGHVPELRGSATISAFTFRHPAMLQPMEQVQARVVFDGTRVAVDRMRAVIGSSDASGSVTLEGIDPPRLLVDLSSSHADFWELFSFISTEEPSAGTGPAAAQAYPLADLEVGGRIAIATGSLHTLSFRNLTGTIAFDDRVLTLDPLEMDLYEGRFRGRLTHDLRTTPATLTLRGAANGVSADPFLAANLGLGGFITGLSSTDLAVELRAGDQETIIRSLSGGGPLRVSDGHLAKLEVLRPLSKAAGVFGQNTLKRLTRQLASEGTRFSRLEMQLGFAEGRARFDKLVLESPDLELRGGGVIDMTTADLDGRFTAVFSPEISASMRDEGSRAASLFWDGASGRVAVPFTLKGPSAAPAAGVDWQQATRGVVERKLTDGLRKILDLPPKTGPEAAPPPPAPETEPQTGLAPASEPAAPEPPPPPPLRAEITRRRWGGSLLAPDLTIEGVVRGASLDRASVVVVDSKGREVERVDRLPAVAGHVASAADPAAPATVPWAVTIDGKRLLIAGFPLTVRVTVLDRSGASAETSAQVDRR